MCQTLSKKTKLMKKVEDYIHIWLCTIPIGYRSGFKFECSNFQQVMHVMLAELDF